MARMPNPQNKKKKTKPKPQPEPSPGLADPGKLVPTEEEPSADSEQGGINGYHVNGCAHDTESVDSLSERLDALSVDARELEDCEAAAPAMPDRTGQSLWGAAGDGHRAFKEQRAASCPLGSFVSGQLWVPSSLDGSSGASSSPRFLLSARCRRGGQGSAVLLTFPCKRVCFSTAVPELENGIAGFDTKSLTMHPSQSPSSLRQRPEQRSASRSLSRSTASTSAPACPPGARLDDVPVSPANKKLGKALGGLHPLRCHGRLLLAKFSPPLPRCRWQIAVRRAGL